MPTPSAIPAASRPNVTPLTWVLGGLLLVNMIMVGVQGWFGLEWLLYPSAISLLAVFGIVLFVGGRVSRLFVWLTIAGVIITLLVIDEPGPVIWDGIKRGLFFQGFMASVFTLQEAALRSRMLQRIGLYLIGQPIQRRSIFVMLGTQVMAVMMNLGSLILIGTIATANKRDGEPPDAAQRQVALSSVRGFAPSSMWSPLAVPPIFVGTLLPGVNMAHVMPQAMLIAALMLLSAGVFTYLGGRGSATSTDMTGLPRVALPWASFAKLALMITLIFAAIKFASVTLSLSIATVVTLLIPLTSLIWLAVQCRGRLNDVVTGPIRNIIGVRLPQQASETTVFVAAGLLGPMVLAMVPFDAITGFFMANHVSPQIIAIVVFLATVGLSLVGVNAILTVTVAIALVGDPAAIGMEPTFYALVLLSAWSLCAQFSPFTATTIVAGRLFGVSPITLSFRWNGAYLAFCVLSGVVVIVAHGILF